MPVICDGCGHPKARCTCLEDALVQQLTFAGLPEPERECRLSNRRKFRFDLCWRDRMLAVEIEGGIYTGGAHGRLVGIKRDLEKGNLAIVTGWRVLRFHGDQVRDGSALRFIEFVMQVLRPEFVQDTPKGEHS